MFVILAILGGLDAKTTVYSLLSAIVAIIFAFAFKYVLPRRKITLYKRSDGTVKCSKCNKVAENGKIYCKKHSAINKTIFMLKWLFLHFIVAIIYWFYVNYQEKVTIPEAFPKSDSEPFIIFTMTVTCIAILFPLYMYTKFGGRESTESTALDITYIEAPEQENEERKEFYDETIRNEITNSITDEPQKAKIPTKHSPKVAIVVVLILLVASIGFNVFLFQRSSMNEQRLSEAQVELSKKQDEIKSLEWDVEYWRERRDEEEAKRYQEYSKYIFLYRHAACINEGFIYYHHPDCEHFDKSSFYIQNTEWAENEGYKPCPYCWPKN